MRLIEKEKMEIKANEERENENQWEIKAQSAIQKIEFEQVKILNEVDLLASRYKSLLPFAKDLKKLQESIEQKDEEEHQERQIKKTISPEELKLRAEDKSNDLKEINTNFQYLKHEIYETNLVLIAGHKIVTNALSEAEKTFILESQIKFYDTLQSKWDGICEDMVQLAGIFQLIDLAKNTIPHLENLQKSITASRDTILKKRKGTKISLPIKGMVTLKGMLISQRCKIA